MKRKNCSKHANAEQQAWLISVKSGRYADSCERDRPKLGAGERMVAHTGLEPVISALRGQRVNQLHQCALLEIDYRYRSVAFASLRDYAQITQIS
jgi:hypothetical protein